MNGLDAHVRVHRGDFALDARIVASAGEIVAVMGPSGAGKSTLLAVIVGQLRTPDSTVSVAGVEVSSPRRNVAPQRRGVVLLGQDARLFPHLTAADNVAFGLRARGRSRAQAAAEAADWLGRMGLADHGARSPRELSGGQQQRVALARALATRPRVLLLDEPLTGLDPETAADIRAVLAEQLPQTGTTTVLVTHNVIDAAALAARLVLLEHGHVSQDGPVREVLTTPETAFGASISGVSRLVGEVSDEVWRSGTIALAAPGCRDGAAIAFLPPGAVQVDPDAGGRGDLPVLARWRTRIHRLEATVAGVRALTADPAVWVELPAAAIAGHGIAAGSGLALRVDPAVVRVVPA